MTPTVLEFIIMGRGLLINRINVMRKIELVTFLILMILVFYSCNYCKFFGDNKLGGNFTLLEGDQVEDRVIVYCTDKSGGCCNAGIPVIPSRIDSISSYVANAISNDIWIIARTINKDKSESYWIINKDFEVKLQYDDGGKLNSLIQSYVSGPFDLLTFQKKKEELKIDLAIEN